MFKMASRQTVSTTILGETQSSTGESKVQVKTHLTILTVLSWNEGFFLYQSHGVFVSVKDCDKCIAKPTLPLML